MVAIERGGLVNRSSRQWPTNKGKRVALVAIALLHVHHKDIETDASNFTRIKKVILREQGALDVRAQVHCTATINLPAPANSSSPWTEIVVY